MEIKDFSDAIIKVASINDDRIKVWDDFEKGMALYDKIRRILSIRNQYQAIANWLFWDELTKGYYTPEDSALGKSCLDGIAICNQELNAICGKAITDKVQSEILSILFHRKDVK
ncbi:hypothetical protein [Parabacteroides goldsteinii]|uniref:hypothetical protein n=1 Tax=Parabacteroides goldsteinii TaxID=328812 RepID=UPI003AB140CF